MLLPHFDIFCDLLLNMPTATWIFLILYTVIKNQNNFIGDVIFAFVLLQQTLFATYVRVLSRGLYWVNKELSCLACSLGISLLVYSFILVTAVIA